MVMLCCIIIIVRDLKPQTPVYKSIMHILYPETDGNSNQVITTDGSGNLSFASVGSLAGSDISNVSDDTSPQLGVT